MVVLDAGAFQKQIKDVVDAQLHKDATKVEFTARDSVKRGRVGTYLTLP